MFKGLGEWICWAGASIVCAALVVDLLNGVVYNIFYRWM